MAIKNIILNQKDSKLLEDAVVRFGRIVTFNQCVDIFKSVYKTRQTIKNRVAFLSGAGWLVRVKKGLFLVVTDLASRSTSDVSNFILAAALNRHSYISFENALWHHSMFDQMLSGTSAVTVTRVRKYRSGNTDTIFCHIAKRLFFGFDKVKAEIGSVNIAHIEKALLDMLYFRKNAGNISLVWEKLAGFKDRLDFNRLTKYALRFNRGIVREVGFLLDRLGVETIDLYERVRGDKSYIRMTKDAREFDSKWRVYFDRKYFK